MKTEPSKPLRKKLGELLVENGMVTPHQLETALRSQQEYGGRLGGVLVRLGFISERNLVLFLKKHLGIPGVDLGRFKTDPHVLAFVPKDLAKKWQALPLAIKKKGDKKHLFLAMSDPTNIEAIEAIQSATKMVVQPVVASDGQLIDALGIYYDGLSGGTMHDFHDDITLDPNDTGEMMVFQGGNAYQMSESGSVTLNDEKVEPHPSKSEVSGAREKASAPPHRAQAPSPALTPPPVAAPTTTAMKDPLSALKQPEKPSHVAAPAPTPANSEGEAVKLAMAIAQLLIDRGIITKRELIELIKTM